MTQQLGLCLLKMLLLLLFLLFEPIVSQNNQNFNTRQDRSSYIDTTQYNTENFGEAPAANRRNFEYQQYRPQQQIQRELIYGPAQYYRRQVYGDSLPQESQQFNTHVQQPQQRALPPARVPFPYQQATIASNTNIQQAKQSPTTVHKRPNIIYPDQSPENTSFNGCDYYEGQSLCKKVRNYPKLLHLDRILKQEFTQLGLFFAEDLELPLNVKQRFGGDPDEIDPCDSEERIIYPEAGMTKDLRWMLIVNDNTTYKQGVRIEECSGKDRPCNVIHQNLPNHYTSVCRQHYNYRQLVAITDTGRVVKDHFKIPSCCKCMLRNVSPF